MTETTEPTVAAAQPENKTPETATTPAAEGDSAPAAVSGSEEKPTTNGDASAETTAEATPAAAAAPEEPAKEPVKEMRAVVLTGFGGYKGVKIQKKPEPTAQAGEVLIRVRAW